MAKRKSKTGKQKQAKAAGKKFGVSVKKGRDQPKITMLSASSSTTVVVKKKQLDGAPIKAGDIKKKGFTPFPHHNKKNTKKLNRNQKKNGQHNPTNNAFGKEMQSAQERSWVQHSRDKEKKTMPTLTPATLIVDDHKKSTQRLMEEATNQVSSGMQGIGAGLVQQVRQDYPLGRTTNQLQVLAAQYRSEEQPSPLETNNPWAALHQGDSDDDDEEEMVKPAPRVFQFAPPSFVVDDDVDPDL
jgi:hypothetical protein